MVEAARSRRSRMNQALPKGGYYRPQPARHGDELRDPPFPGGGLGHDCSSQSYRSGWRLCVRSRYLHSALANEVSVIQGAWCMVLVKT